MSNNTNTGGPAFPLFAATGYTGMTLRDYFAAQVMHHWLSLPIDKHQREKLATEAYTVADAMLSARGTEKAREA